jgi:TatD DNase family protein
MLIDIHTHRSGTKSYNKKNKNQLRFVVGKHSLGIHPWELLAPFDEDLYKKRFQQLKQKLNASVLAVGECGLDRRRGFIAEIETQIKVLEWHMDWAIELKKPIVIHCVKAHSDLLKLLKAKKYKGKVLLHDYAGNVETAQEFLAYDCYFSFGQRLFKNSKAAEVLRFLPLEKLFLETDDQEEFGIEALYQRAQLLLGIDQESLEKRLEKNLIEFFSNLDNVSTADIIDNLRNARDS